MTDDPKNPESQVPEKGVASERNAELEITNPPTERTKAVRTLPEAARVYMWPKGFCPNPGGRSRDARDLEILARTRTAQGKDLIDLWVNMLNDTAPGLEGKLDIKWRAWASQRLAERGWGKPKLVIESTRTETRLDVGRLAQRNPEALVKLERALTMLAELEALQATARPLALPEAPESDEPPEDAA